MTDSVSLLTLSLCKWLQDPKIRIEASSAEEVAALQMQVQSLQAELAKTKHENEIFHKAYGSDPICRDGCGNAAVVGPHALGGGCRTAGGRFGGRQRFAGFYPWRSSYVFAF